MRVATLPKELTIAAKSCARKVIQPGACGVHVHADKYEREAIVRTTSMIALTQPHLKLNLSTLSVHEPCTFSVQILASPRDVLLATLTAVARPTNGATQCVQTPASPGRLVAALD